MSLAKIVFQVNSYEVSTKFVQEQKPRGIAATRTMLLHSTTAPWKRMTLSFSSDGTGMKVTDKGKADAGYAALRIPESYWEEILTYLRCGPKVVLTAEYEDDNSAPDDLTSLQFEVPPAT